jgi:DNA-binding NarL/FixJ family response regulator
MIAIAVLEDNEVLRHRMVKILSVWDQVSSITEFSCNADLYRHASTEKIDILLADLNVEDGSGIDSIAYLASVQPDTISIVVSALSDSDSIIRAISKGALGYLHKDDSSFEIISAIKMALEGVSPISPAIARKLMMGMQAPGKQEKPTSRNTEGAIRKGVLTAREIEVLNLISKGLSYTECSAVLNMSEKTVPVHVRNIYRKLHAKNRSEAVFEARFLGVIE